MPLRSRKTNAAQLNLNNVRILEGNWFCELGQERFDLIVSNPPYVAEGDLISARAICAMSRTALTAGGAGLECIESIVASAPAHLAANAAARTRLRSGASLQGPVEQDWIRRGVLSSRLGRHTPRQRRLFGSLTKQAVKITILKGILSMVADFLKVV